MFSLRSFLIIRGILGEGGYATVKKGTLNNVDVAVKILKDAADGLPILEEFRHEIQIQGGLRSPYIVNILGMFPVFTTN